MANYFLEVLHGKSIAGAKKLNSAKISLYITPGGHYYCYALYMHTNMHIQCQLGRTAYSSVFKRIVTAMFEEVMMLLMMVMTTILTTVTIIIE